MKQFLLPFLFLLSTLSAFAQSPQGINYQAVAYTGLGQPVLNQSVGVRLSVLDGGANGPVLYQETQQPSTDNTGLFSIVLGNGTPVSGSFPAINWSVGTKWLKSEIDIAGGNNYVVMGSSQFMSVPYALYANVAGFANRSSFTSGSFTIPDGFAGATMVIIEDSTDYVVPAGKNLYLPTPELVVSIDGDTMFANIYGGGANARNFIAASENSVVWVKADPAGGFLVDKTVQWKTVDVRTAPFTVPQGKQFVIVNTCTNAGGGFNFDPQYIFTGFYSTCKTTINGSPCRLISNMILAPGTVVSYSGCTDPSYLKYIILNGYYIDL